jgi:hypothetical protein
VKKLHEITDCYLLPLSPNPITKNTCISARGWGYRLLPKAGPLHADETAYNSCSKHPPKIRLFAKKLF